MPSDYSPVMQKFSEYMNRKDLKRKDFAKSIGVSMSALSMWSKGHRSPSDEHKALIEIASGGEIAFEDWKPDVELPANVAAE